MGDIIGHGVTLAGGTTGTVGKILSIGIPGRTADMIDVTAADSADKTCEYLVGLIDEGEITVEVKYDGSNSGIAQKLNTAFQGRAAESWTITLPDSSTFVGSGAISNLGPPIPIRDKVTQTITIKLSGKLTYTPAS